MSINKFERVASGHYIAQYLNICRNCKGSGTEAKAICPVCNGAGRVIIRKEIYVTIQPYNQ